MFERFKALKQSVGLIFPSTAVLKIVKATEIIFRKRVVGQNMEINIHDQKIECTVFEKLGPSIFNNVLGHFFEHRLGKECDHLSSLLNIIIKYYLDLQLRKYGRKFSEMVVHQNQHSSRHELTKTIFFQNL